jgi:hypothetical protein
MTKTGIVAQGGRVNPSGSNRSATAQIVAMGLQFVCHPRNEIRAQCGQFGTSAGRTHIEMTPRVTDSVADAPKTIASRHTVGRPDTTSDRRGQHRSETPFESSGTLGPINRIKK